MSADSSVPFSRLNILVHRTLLEIKTLKAVNNMKVHHRVQWLRPAVTICPAGSSDDKPGRFYYRKPFLRMDILLRNIYRIRRHHRRYIIWIN